jgi:hypothetical protein
MEESLVKKEVPSVKKEERSIKLEGLPVKAEHVDILEVKTEPVDRKSRLVVRICYS